MSNPLILRNTCIFHITHLKNLSSILRNGLLSKNKIASMRVRIKDISNSEIQDARAIITIPNTSHTLHDCVPMFFGARPAMLYAIKAKGVAQEEIVYVLVNWNIIGQPTTWFTDGNARDWETSFHQNVSDLQEVDFEAAGAYYWGDRGDEFKRKKQAEVLKLDQVPLEEILGFVVYNKDVKGKVKDILKSQEIDKKVFVVPEYYYD